MKDLVHHYSLMLVPFLAASVQATFGPGILGVNAYPQWFRGKASTLVVAWAVLAFVLLSRLTFYFGQFHDRFDALQAFKDVTPLVSADSRLLTNNHLAPHYSQRRWIGLAGSDGGPVDLDRYDQVLLDERHPGWNASPELVRTIRGRLSSSEHWSLQFDRDGLWLFERLPSNSVRMPRSRQQ